MGCRDRVLGWGSGGCPFVRAGIGLQLGGEGS